MKLLAEEFFGKVFKFVNGINIVFIKGFVKLIFYGIVACILILTAQAIYNKEYVLVFGIIGLYVIGELAHYTRKSQEKKLALIAEEKREVDEALNKNLLNLDKK